MPGKFEIKTASNGKFFFNLKAGNGEVILSSQMYKAKPYALRGIASVKKNAVDDARYEVRDSANGEQFFVLKAGNSQVIGKSETYPTKQALQKGIASVKKNAPEASIVEIAPKA